MVDINPAPDVIDMLFEGLTIFGYLFIFAMVLLSRWKNKIFASKPFPLLIIGIILGFCSAIMDFLSEILWFDQDFYKVYKLTMGILVILSLFLFAIGLLLLFKFTSFLMGDDSENDKEKAQN